FDCIGSMSSFKPPDGLYVLTPCSLTALDPCPPLCQES
ncbi:hypothetical protein A2U01_0051047, partial [Trifolium medium]|nr:hypothetical protein [Trifolium medium]